MQATLGVLSVLPDANTRLHILETMMDLPTAEKEQNAAFIVSLSAFLNVCSHDFDGYMAIERRTCYGRLVRRD